MKRKEDDLARLDGVQVPLWAKILAFVISFAIAFALFYFLQSIF